MLFKTPRIQDRFKENATLKADLIIRALNKMGCDVINVGYSDLAMGKDFLLERQKTANFPFISANLVDKKTGKPLFKPYVIKQINGLKVGIFGLITSKTRIYQVLGNVSVKQPIEAAGEAIKQLKGKCDIIVGLVHLETQEDVKLAQEVEGINFIINGYRKSPRFRPGKTKSTETSSTKVNSTVILGSNNKGRYLGRLDITTVDDQFADYSDYSEKPGILSQLGTIKDEIKQFGEKLDSSSDAKRITNALKNLEKAEKQLKDVRGGSHYTSTTILLDNSINEKPDIKTLVKQHKDYVGEIRKQKVKMMPHHDEPDARGEDDEMIDHGLK